MGIEMEFDQGRPVTIEVSESDDEVEFLQMIEL